MPLLTEFPRVRQIPGEPPRRWFSCEGVDLIAWYNDALQPFGFQLCYFRGGVEQALTWRCQGPADHKRVHSGNRGFHGWTPVLTDDSVPDLAYVRELIADIAEPLPVDLRVMVDAVLSAYPDAPPLRRAPPLRVPRPYDDD